ncbi:MAG: aldehyde dehydrogenase [Bacteroidia bacterium]|nr:aldehyde dehydrogenase [Bacteroidia bacterium]
MVEDILRKQRAFFKAGYTLDVKGRRAVLQILANTIQEMEGEILEALKKDLGKSETESYMCEIGLALSQIRDTKKHLKRWARTKRVPTPLAQFPSHSRIMPEPYGNVLIMSPWNYPFLLCISPLISALAAGNTAIIKPSAYAPATSAVIKKIIEETFTEDYVAVVEGGREVNTNLLDQKFDYIFFTGSKAVGRVVMAKAAVNLTPVTLELGGKSPVIIDSECDLQVAARRVMFGKCLNAGQTCVAPDHVFVHESIAQAFMDACIAESKAMYGEDALQNGNYGKIISAKHFERLTDILEDCRRLICFGGASDSEALRIGPTIVNLGALEPKDEDGSFSIDSYKVMQEEIFGPVLPVISYSDIIDVVDYIDSHDKPLATYIFTKDKYVKNDLLRALHFGGGCVNDTMIHLATERMPFGGVGASGMGSYHGKWGFDTFTHYKSIVDKNASVDIRMRYQPYDEKKLKLIKKFL